MMAVLNTMEAALAVLHTMEAAKLHGKNTAQPNPSSSPHDTAINPPPLQFEARGGRATTKAVKVSPEETSHVSLSRDCVQNDSPTEGEATETEKQER